MSLHDPHPGGKPWRLGLYLPFALLLVAVIAWTGFWLWARTEAQARIDAAVADLGRAGYQISWQTRSLGGYPFRLTVALTGAQVREPAGWALQAPRLEGEAYLYAPTHWLFAAPQGLTFVRPQGGPVAVTARSLIASLTHLDARPPSLSVQVLDATFQPAPGATPFSLSSAGKAELHLRAGPDDEGGVFLSVENARARAGGVLGRIAGDKPVAITWNSTLSKMSAFQGQDWADAVRRWTEAGGAMTVRPGSQLIAGQALAAVRSGTLSAGRDGRLRGVLDLNLRQAPSMLAAMAEAGVIPRYTADAARAVADARQEGDVTHAAVAFEAGQTTLGPVALTPAPRIYTPP
jgi:hypothetical protein